MVDGNGSSLSFPTPLLINSKYRIFQDTETKSGSGVMVVYVPADKTSLQFTLSQTYTTDRITYIESIRLFKLTSDWC